MRAAPVDFLGAGRCLRRQRLKLVRPTVVMTPLRRRVRVARHQLFFSFAISRFQLSCSSFLGAV